jgi:hypothetical protein
VFGVTKNFFAGSEFKISVVVLQLTALFCVSILPFLALPLVHGWMLALVLLSIMIAIGFHAGTRWVMRASPLYAFTHPIGAAIFSYMLLRSTVVTLVQGGIVWRGTFYPLDELRRGIVSGRQNGTLDRVTHLNLESGPLHKPTATNAEASTSPRGFAPPSFPGQTHRPDLDF